MLYEATLALFCPLAKIFLRFRVIGADNLPAEGGVILAANHVSYLDIPLLACSVPRRVDFMGKMELFRNPLTGPLFRRLGGFPVRRGEVDRSALEEAVKRLREGRVVAIYPEGTRSRDGILRPGKAGIGMLVARSGARVVPAYIRGTDRWRRFSSVTVTLAPAMDFSGLLSGLGPENRREIYDRIVREIMGEIALLK